MTAPSIVHTRNASGRKLPSFIILGPPRTGTSWLHDVLSPMVTLPAPTKETRFFDEHFSRGMDWYLDHYRSVDQSGPIGEVAPTYFASAQARERIAATLPGVKLVFIFREPVQRLISLYRLKRAYGMFSWSLSEALERDAELMASSRYATHLRAWQELFPPEQLSINFYEDLSANPGLFMDQLCDFIEAPRFELNESQQKKVFSTTRMTEPRSYLATRAATTAAGWLKARSLDSVVATVRDSRLCRLILGGGAPFEEVDAEMRCRLASLLMPEIEELENILGRDLSTWKKPAA